jgi:iron(III) transport system substrate-binding protein
MRPTRPIGYKPPISIFLILNLFATTLLAACSTNHRQPQVVIYVSVDQVYAEPVLKSFETQTGIKVLPVYDVEAAKTTGLVNRLLAEANNPQADVYWNGEFAQTILLKQSGILAAYQSPNAQDIPAIFKDSQGYWTGFGGRARILLVNSDQLDSAEEPASIYDLLDPRYPPERVGLAYPLFGTMATHAAALYAQLGPEKAQSYFQSLADRGVQIVDGNSVVKDRVAAGDWLFGLTDTDDACQAIQRGAHVRVIFPDQGPGELGTLIVPNTAAIIAGGPNPQQGRVLVDYLLSLEIEDQLVQSGWSQFPLRPVKSNPQCYEDLNIQTMQVDLEQVYAQTETAKETLGDVFLR